MKITGLDSMYKIQKNIDANGDIANDNKINFSQYLKSALDDVNSLQLESEKYKEMMAVGKVDNIHEVMIASEKASIALQLTTSIRNKVVDAYKEIMRMQI
ncbi:flagellar hook-basal body complex protein FliE [Clostridiisalibacter paucivorans]|uniref:flagellar hook-basal body complex protein FliE n=1 Tax=Clostridiisalibacter paucivorans TaxID=408753 RepID=UPI00047951A3|nr:flagellar hook-basal body complex protein FliE [Clostridiisalibacter paucivorans]